MESPIFVPTLPPKVDGVSKQLRLFSQIIFLTTLMLVPLFVVPTLTGLALFPKVYLVLFGSLLALLFVSLFILRNGTVTLRLTPVILAWWLVVGTGVVSAIFSPNLKNALFGDTLETQTVGFLAIMGLVMSLLPLIGNSKKFTIYLYGSFIVSGFLAALLFVGRVLFGSDFLSMGVLKSLTDNPVGSFNDLGIFLGCIVMVSLVTLAQLDLPKKGLGAVALLLVLTLGVLANVNFFFVWLLLTLFSLLLLMYMLTKDRFGQLASTSTHHSLPLGSVSMIGLVFFVSALFLIGGSSFGTLVSHITGVNYLEIRPSLSATIDIMRPIYADHAVTGFGPNRFVEAWSLYKDGSINATVFWNTPFTAGAGYISTWFVTTGILGLVAWLLFLAAFMYTGVRTLLVSKESDSFWFFMGSVSFVAGLFIWILSLVYVPGTAILILGAICTGTLVVAERKLSRQTSRTINLLSTSKTGFVLIALVMIGIIGILSVGYGATKQVTAAYTFLTATNNIAVGNPSPVTVVSEKIARAYALYPTDTYARALTNYQLSYLNSLLVLTEPTPAEQQQFQNTISAALNAGTQAITQKPTDARNWQMLGDIYAALSLVAIEGSKERAFDSYKKAEELDPTNPLYVLQKAAIEARSGNSLEARRLAQLALALKPNYTDALYLLSQLDIAAGDIATAITMTESIISIEANNPGRYYQLGVLYGAVQNTPAAIEAFTTAIRLDPNYANARYFLAQQYVILGEVNKAIAELEIVRSLSPDNGAVDTLINQIESGAITADTLKNSQTIPEKNSVITANGVTTVDTVPDSELLTPVNPAATPVSESASEEVPVTAQTPQS